MPGGGSGGSGGGHSGGGHGGSMGGSRGGTKVVGAAATNTYRKKVIKRTNPIRGSK